MVTAAFAFTVDRGTRKTVHTSVSGYRRRVVGLIGVVIRERAFAACPYPFLSSRRRHLGKFQAHHHLAELRPYASQFPLLAINALLQSVPTSRRAGHAAILPSRSRAPGSSRATASSASPTQQAHHEVDFAWALHRFGIFVGTSAPAGAPALSPTSSRSSWTTLVVSLIRCPAESGATYRHRKRIY
jgi:hypothetical protein